MGWLASWQPNSAGESRRPRDRESCREVTPPGHSRFEADSVKVVADADRRAVVRLLQLVAEEARLPDVHLNHAHGQMVPNVQFEAAAAGIGKPGVGIDRRLVATVGRNIIAVVSVAKKNLAVGRELVMPEKVDARPGL